MVDGGERPVRDIFARRHDKEKNKEKKSKKHHHHHRHSSKSTKKSKDNAAKESELVVNAKEQKRAVEDDSNAAGEIGSDNNKIDHTKENFMRQEKKNQMLREYNQREQMLRQSLQEMELSEMANVATRGKDEFLNGNTGATIEIDEQL